MIKATFVKSEGCIKSYKVEGHAKYAEHGKDIVCAAVSALGQTITHRLNPFTIRDQTEFVEGLIDVVLSRTNTTTMELTETLLLGLRLISNDYPNHVTVEVIKDE